MRGGKRGGPLMTLRALWEGLCPRGRLSSARLPWWGCPGCQALGTREVEMGVKGVENPERA